MDAENFIIVTLTLSCLYLAILLTIRLFHTDPIEDDSSKVYTKAELHNVFKVRVFGFYLIILFALALNMNSNNWIIKLFLLLGFTPPFILFLINGLKRPGHE